MKTLSSVYINGRFVETHGKEVARIYNPANNELIGELVLGNEQDALDAIESAKNAFASFSTSTREERMNYLQRLHDAVAEQVEALRDATIEEYGATMQRSLWANRYAADTFLYFKDIVRDFDFERTIGKSKLWKEPVGVTAILTPWNSSAGSIAVKLGAAIAAGCTTVIKPSEMSALQTEILMACFAKADLPPGVINVINGRGDVMGPVLSTHPDVSMVLFTGSTTVGKIIARNAVDTMKRVTLELSGKSPNIILDDANLETAIPLAVNACFQNNGQACIAASRLLVPERMLPEVKRLVIQTVGALKVGDPRDERTAVGPLANGKQYERIQHYIKTGIAEGAELLIGGEGKPQGLEQGNYVYPTVFSGVTSDMTIAREEIFGPVLSIMTYTSEAEAIRIANDTIYGLHAYVSSSNIERANKVASQIRAGRVAINVVAHDALAPFGGYKQSGVGREGGVFGLEALLESKVIIG